MVARFATLILTYNLANTACFWWSDRILRWHGLLSYYAIRAQPAPSRVLLSVQCAAWRGARQHLLDPAAPVVRSRSAVVRSRRLLIDIEGMVHSDSLHMRAVGFDRILIKLKRR